MKLRRDRMMDSGSKPMVGPIEAVGLGFRKCVRFGGRTTRAEYWWWVLFVFLGRAVFQGVDDVINSETSLGENRFRILFTMAILLPTMSATVRRLHDIGKTGWWLAAWLASLLGGLLLVGSLGGGVADSGGLIVALVFIPWAAFTIWWIVWTVRQGEPGGNRFGPDPRA